MKKFLWQAGVILGISIIIALTYNQFSRSPLPIFKTFDAHHTALVINGEKNNDATEPVLIPHFEEIDAETIQSLMESGGGALLDARKTEEYNAGHIPGAISLPISKFQETYPTAEHLLKNGKIIIVYCIGSDCTDSSLLAMELQNKGCEDIFVYKGGFEDWTALGNPVETCEGEDQ